MSDQFNSIPLLPREECVKRIVSLLPSNPLIVEAGAFNGSDTRCFVKQWPESTIHAFEPVPSIFEQLVENTRLFPNVTCHQLALSNSNGTALLHIAEKHSKPGIPSQASSLLVPNPETTSPRIHFPTSIQVPTITLDSWAEQNQITHLDLLWLDLQGLELAVSQAALHTLKKTHVIVLEAATIQRYEGQPLADEIIAWMHVNGFKAIARDFDGIDLKFGNVVFRNQR